MINKNIHVDYIYILEWINNLCNKTTNGTFLFVSYMCSNLKH